LFRNRIDAFAAESVKLCDVMVSLVCEREEDGDTKTSS